MVSRFLNGCPPWHLAEIFFIFQPKSGPYYQSTLTKTPVFEL